jgi:hypothetical protein
LAGPGSGGIEQAQNQLDQISFRPSKWSRLIAPVADCLCAFAHPGVISPWMDLDVV